MEIDNDQEDNVVDAVMSDGNSVDVQSFMRIVHIDVNQGESTLILYQEGEDILYAALIDGGKSQYHRHILATLDAYGVVQLDAIISTHFDADHIEGLTALMGTGEIILGEVFDRGADKNDDKPRAFKRAAGDLYRPMSAFEEVRWPEFSFECLHYNADGMRPQEENDYSTIMQAQLGDFTYYTAGDQCRTFELQYAPSDCAAFKCGHHGSKHSTSKRLLQKMSARLAFISAGSHSYCHPDNQVLDILHDDANIQGIYLTNCSYNRPQVNRGYLAQEAEHLASYLDNIALLVKRSGVLPNRDRMLQRVTQGHKAIAEKKWDVYVECVRALLGCLEAGTPKPVRKAVEAASQATDIYHVEFNRKDARDYKAWVAGTDELLGNIELFVGADGYAVGFVSDEGEDVWHCWTHDDESCDEFEGLEVVRVGRKIDRDASFSLLTAQGSTEERVEIELSPREAKEQQKQQQFLDEADNFSRKMHALRHCHLCNCRISVMNYRELGDKRYCDSCFPEAQAAQVEEQGSENDRNFTDLA